MRSTIGRESFEIFSIRDFSIFAPRVVEIFDSFCNRAKHDSKNLAMNNYPLGKRN